MKTIKVPPQRNPVRASGDLSTGGQVTRTHQPGRTGKTRTSSNCGGCRA